MLLFDIFFYTIYRFLKRVGRSKENAKFSALSFLVIYISFLIITLFFAYGLINDNDFSRSLSESESSYMIIYVIVIVLVYIVLWPRYYRHTDVENIERKYRGLPVFKRRILNGMVYFFMIAVPISFYVFIRLYKFGYV